MSSNNEIKSKYYMLIIIIGLLIIASTFFLLAYKPFLSKSNLANNAESPKTQYVRATRSHIHNLAAHEEVSIPAIDTLDSVKAIPVWLDSTPDNPIPRTYNGLFWEIEPMGEYLYFLAGDYIKNEKGLLRFMSASTSLRAELNFEDDVVNVAKVTGTQEQSKASRIVLDDNFPDNLKLFEITNLSNKFTSLNDSYTGDMSLENFLPSDVKGRARLHFKKNSSNINLTMTYEEFREPISAGESERYLKIFLQSRNPQQELKPLLTSFSSLIAKYHDMPYVQVSGAIRM